MYNVLCILTHPKQVGTHLPEQLDGGMVFGVATAVVGVSSHVSYVQGATAPATQQLIGLGGVKQA